MVRVGGFLKTQNRIRRQRARGRFISPYQIGGTIFGKSTMARYPLMYTSSRLTDPLSMEKRMLRQVRQMKGGDLRQVLWANQAKARRQRMKGGNVFRKLKKRIQIDFPHRPFPAAHPIHDGYRLKKGWDKLRKGIKRGRR